MGVAFFSLVFLFYSLSKLNSITNCQQVLFGDRVFFFHFSSSFFLPVP